MPITADEANIHELLNSNSIYVMPMFQRRYAWDANTGQKNGIRLWRDIDELLDGEVEKSFLGALVVKTISTGPVRPDNIEVIDGQQRITTLFMLLCAIVKWCEKNGKINDAEIYGNTYLINNSNPQMKIPKLRPTLKDTAQFNKTIRELGTISNPHLESNDAGDGLKLRKIYNYHLKEIEKRCMFDGEEVPNKIEEILEAVSKKMSFVLIQVESEYDENKVFETLNESGIPLSAADLVRNLIFSNLEATNYNAENIYNNYWLPFENLLTHNNKEKMKNYFYPYGLSKDSNVTNSSLYRTLKEIWIGKDPIEIIEDLNTHTVAYRGLVFGPQSLDNADVADEQLKNAIGNLFRMKVPTSTYSYLFNLISDSKDKIDASDAVKCIDIIESILVRRSFLDIEPTGMHAQFKTLWNNCGQKADPEKMSEILNGVAYFKIPNDGEFETAIMGKGTTFYKRKLAKYVCLEYERFLNNSGDILDLDGMENITMEHIIPQSLPEGHDYLIGDEDHSDILDSWPNICLLTKTANSQIGNKIWAEKKIYYASESFFRSTREIGENYNEMGPHTIEERGEQLKQFALNRWKLY